MEISSKYAAIKIIPKPDEVGEKNFPPHLHAAAELFIMTGQTGCALQLQSDVDAYIAMLNIGPDGRTAQKLGKACICWHCGHCGIPKDDSAETAVCAKCDSSDQTNYVKLPHPSDASSSLPWLEAHDATAAAAAAGNDSTATSSTTYDKPASD
jgi:transcription elongation factor Elf1